MFASVHDEVPTPAGLLRLARDKLRLRQAELARRAGGRACRRRWCRPTSGTAASRRWRHCYALLKAAGYELRMHLAAAAKRASP